jgi:hypothetical protein
LTQSQKLEWNFGTIAQRQTPKGLNQNSHRDLYYEMLLDLYTYRIEEQFGKALNTLGFLRMTTPRSRYTHHKEPAVEPESKNRNGALFNSKPLTNWTGSNLDPDSVRRHYQGLKRAGFRDNTHAKGGMF